MKNRDGLIISIKFTLEADEVDRLGFFIQLEHIPSGDYFYINVAVGNRMIDGREICHRKKT